MGESHGIRQSHVQNFTGNLATIFTIFARRKTVFQHFLLRLLVVVVGQQQTFVKI